MKKDMAAVQEQCASKDKKISDLIKEIGMAGEQVLEQM